MAAAVASPVTPQATELVRHQGQAAGDARYQPVAQVREGQ